MRYVSTTNYGVHVNAITKSSDNVTCPSIEDLKGRSYQSNIYTADNNFDGKCKDFTDANFKAAVFNSSVDFSGSTLTNANFESAVFNDSVDFRSTNLTNANFKAAVFNYSVDFRSANLTDANFEAAVLTNPTSCPNNALCQNLPPPPPPKEVNGEVLAGQLAQLETKKLFQLTEQLSQLSQLIKQPLEQQLIKQTIEQLNKLAQTPKYKREEPSVLSKLLFSDPPNQQLILLVANILGANLSGQHFLG
jgi:uncharacterized protein YjbI with pentapeptide repeats